MNARAFGLSALLAGIVVALLGHLPIINLFNCFLCMWVWGGGILAVYLYRRFNRTAPGDVLSGGQAAGLGAAAGAVGALLGSLVSMAVAAMGISLLPPDLLNQPDAAPWVEMLSSGSFSVLGVFIDLVLYAIFGALGALLAVKVIWKPRPVPMPPIEP